MSQIPETTVPTSPKRHTGLFIIIAAVILLLLLILLYIGGSFMLPGWLKASYQGKDCAAVLSLNNTYTSVYPAAMLDKSVTAPVNECALYTLASGSDAQHAWQDSYNAYKSYSELYPKGLFSTEAHEHIAAVLVAWSKDLLAQKKYDQAAGKLDLVFTSYNNTAAAADTAGLMTQVYTAWGADQRGSSDFSGAENTLKTFETWAQNAKQSEAVKSAQHERAQTYLSWGSVLQTQKQFDDAKAKLDLAISTDPQPLATSGPAAQAKAAQAKLYIQWGDDFLAKKDFAGAIDHYRTAITLSESKDQPAAKDAVANAYLQWAASLRDTEDYLGALQQIEEAGKNTGTGAAVKLVESAKTDTYTAFSKSSGTQAQKAMKDAIKAVCAGTKPDLPIFGLDKYNVRAALAGTDYSLPDNVLAKTPDALHYVACIVIETVKVEKRDIPIWTGSGWTNGQMVREKNNWHVTLYRVDNAALVQKTDIAGGNPPPLPAITRSNYISIFTGGIYQRYKGSDPDVVELANWMLGVMK